MYIFQPDRYLLKKQISEASHYIKGKVLDIGAGEHDRYSSYFKDKKEYIKMDIKPGPNVDVVGSVDSIPLEDDSVDSVVCTQVFEHLKNIDSSAKEIYRVLKKGGHILITVPQTSELHEEPNDFFRYTNFGLRSVFEKAGFKVVNESQRGGFFSVIAQMTARYCIDKFRLYSRPTLGRFMGGVLSLSGKFGIWLDSKDRGKANRKHAIGWCFVFEKK